MSQKKPFPFDGVLNINKPAGMTSHDVVDRIRKVARMRRIGHTGTLDPMATGVLPLCLGQATKIAQFLLALDKEYLVEMVLGRITDSQDTTGSLLEERPVPGLFGEEIEKVLDAFRGEIRQIPPMISAKKHKGDRLYKLAREGVDVEREPCEITVHELELLKVELPRVRFRLVCSKGTYVRTLCHDIGQAIGCGGAMCGLIRTRCGSFDIRDSVPLEDIEREGLIEGALFSMDRALSSYPLLRIAEREERALANGQAIGGAGIIEIGSPFEAGSLVRVQGRNGRLVAIARALLNSEKLETMGANLKTVQPVKVFG